ncbi:MAG: DUF4976 domain-containing protein, partial [Algoriphagus sp.]|nr:DUF4976 domain-containing protein [Algoriphagus sp.]
MPTFAEILGEKSPEGIDGKSFLPALLGKTNQQKHDHLYWEFHELGGRQAVLKDGWKLVKYQVKDPSKLTVELFDLSSDPAESKNL